MPLQICFAGYAMNSRSGFVALMGASNVGKSTLFNRLAGSRLSIVTPKPQTTRRRIRGIVVQRTPGGDLAEIVLVDVPGIFTPRRRLDRAMIEAAWNAAMEADVVLLMVDAQKPDHPEVSSISTRLATAEKPAMLVINKVDLVPRPRLLPLASHLNTLASFRSTYLVSAASGDGTADLLAALGPLMPEGPHLYPSREISDLSERMLASELVREQIFRQGREEVPYDAAVEIASWEERRDGSVRVGATIVVARPGQKAILIGARGERIREIGTRARAHLTEALGRTVHLVLRVEVVKHWAEDEARLRSLGLGPLGYG